MTGTALPLGLFGTGLGIGLLVLGWGWRGGPSPGSLLLWRRGAGWRGRLRADRDWRWLTAAGAAGILVGVLTGWIVGAILAAMGVWGVPRMLSSTREHRQQIARVDAVAGWTEMLRDTLAAAAGLEQAILATASIAPAAIRPEVLELAARLDRGDRLPPAFRALAGELADPTADLVINALIAACEHQARQLGPLLGRLAQIARARVEMRERVQTSRARTRTTVRVVVITFAVFAAGLIGFNRAFLAPYDTAAGQLVLLLIGAIVTVAFHWLRRTAHIDEPERFLTESLDVPAVDREPESVTAWQVRR